ncbi:hypothetical protein CcI49_18180 [Frankia sp. CcI49]|uniref:nSTAND1 domain-containing NTPase n=1 Tax=Frankia sp. CcI49 TaxID=1745382 RepID=UPI0009780F62|nr:TIR domain-containing protein [Frankia sp. CcI49]ONH59074.1 hypothetical protein CcI49_18180 [Frankia sp. CcI49]
MADGDRIFLSYAEADREWVAGYLTPALGLRADQVLTADQFPPGEPVVTAFEQAVLGSRATVVVLTPAYLTDRWALLAELLASYQDIAVDGTGAVGGAAARVVPVLREPCDIPLRVGFRVRLDFTDRSRWEAQAARLRAFLAQPEPPVAEEIRCPYPGLAPFGRTHTRFFHGRDREISDLRRRVRSQPFTLVVGPSGSGKSSLVLAGLVPRLGADPDRWLVRTLRPGAAPMSALTGALELTRRGPTAQLSVPAASAVAGLLAGRVPSDGEVTSDGEAQPAGRLLLVVDQLEEVFAQAPADARAAFLATLVELRGVESCRVVATLRADFYPELMTSPLWPLDLGERVEIAPLRGASLREAIVRPAGDVGVQVDRGLVERLIADAADEPGSLPLVQETMATLWDERDRRLLTLATYDQLGTDGRGGLAAVLALRADGVLAGLTPAQRAVVRRVLLRLVQPGDGRGDTRRQQPVSVLRAVDEDPAVFDVVLARLLDARLLTPSGDNSGAQRCVDLAHEALIAGWPMLRQWIDTARQDLLVARALARDAEQWSTGGRDDSDLYRGARLAAAADWATANSAELNRLERDFLHAGQARQAGELAAARRTNRRLRWFARGLAAFLTLAIAASGLAVAQSVRAGRQADLAAVQSRAALSRQLAAQAVAAQTSQVSRALLLAAQASRVDDTAEAHSALLSALQNSDPRLVSVLAGSGAGGSAGVAGPVGAGVPVRAVAVSPNGRTVATGSETGTVTWWDADHQRRAGATASDQRDAIQALAFSPDGRTLASGSLDGTTQLWDVAGGRPLGPPLRAAQDSVWAVAFGPGGAVLAVGGGARDGQSAGGQSAGGVATVWDVARRVPVDSFELPGATPVAAVAFSRDGAALSAAGLDGAASIRDLTSHRTRVVQPPAGSFTAAALGADGRTLALGTDAGLVEMWDITAGRQLLPLRADHLDLVEDVAVSSDGRLVAAGGVNHTVVVWDTSTGSMVGDPLRGHAAGLESVAFGPDGRTVVSGDGGGSAIHWDLAGRPGGRAPLTGHRAAVWGLSVSPDGRLLATSSDDGTVMLWDVRGGGGRAVFHGSGQTQALAFTPDGRWLAVGQGGAVALWEVAGDHTVRAVPTGTTAGTTALAVSPDGRWLAAGTSDRTVLLWDLSEAHPAGRRLPPHTGTVTGLAFSPDGRMVASAGLDGIVALWDVGAGRSAGTLGRVGDAGLQSLAFDPAGRILVTGDDHGTIRSWDVARRQPRQSALAAHAGPVYTVAVSADGRTAATGGEDGLVVLWRRDDTGRWYRLDEPLRGHTGAVTNVAFAPDGRTLVSASFDRTARQWDVDPESWRRRACAIANRDLTRTEWSQFVGENLSYESTCGFTR